MLKRDIMRMLFWALVVRLLELVLLVLVLTLFANVIYQYYGNYNIEPYKSFVNNIKYLYNFVKNPLYLFVIPISSILFICFEGRKGAVLIWTAPAVSIFIFANIFSNYYLLPTSVFLILNFFSATLVNKVLANSPVPIVD